MLALARKYRPRNFRTVAVQSHVSNTLKGAIARGRVAHGYLLCGPRGVGKTTLARVLAMALNCENKAGDGEPCGRCTSCERIWSGSTSLDVVEIDAASNRGVDDARELRERAMYAPSGDDRYKVYIVDEAHMLTREAWNALLKVLEEPPPRVVFVFATTEPQKIAQSAAPVLSRLQRFDFRRMSARDVKERITAVLAEEGIEAADDALDVIARAADGSMRDGLSLTDQVLALGEGTVTVERVRDALGLVAEDEFVAILDLIADRNPAGVFPAMERLVDQGVDLGQFLAGLTDMLRAQLAIALGAERADVSERALAELRARKDRLSTGDLVRMLTAVAELEPLFRKSTQQQVLLEAALVRFALLDKTVDLERVLREMGGSGAPDSRSAPRAAPPGTASGTGPASSRASSRPPDPGGSRRLSDSGHGADRSPVRAVAEEPPHARAAEPQRVRPTEPQNRPSESRRERPSESPGPVDAHNLNAIVDGWDRVVQSIRAKRPIFGSLLDHALPTAVTAAGALTLSIDDATAHQGIAGRLQDLTGLLGAAIPGITKVIAKGPVHEASLAPTRMTAESVKTDTLQSLRKKSPTLARAIDELDLELL